MIGEILNAILQECSALLSNTGATVILKTDFKNTKIATYTPPLILLALHDAPDSKQYPGGLTQMDWQWGFNCYNFEPDAYNDDQTGYSASLIDFVDQIRQHFETPIWLTRGMTDIFNTYGFQFTFSGVTVAEALDRDGLIMGYKIGFESTAFDNVTLSIVPSLYPLTTIIQDTEQIS